METTDTIREARRLTRPREGRWLGGVAAGLGEYFDLSPAIYRIAFVALALAGGTGVLLYVAAWLVIPDEGAEDSIAATALKQNRDRPSRALGLAVVAFIAIIALSSAHFWPRPGNLWLAAALGIGALVWWQLSTHPATGEARKGGALFGIALGCVFAVVGAVAVLDVAGWWNADWRIVLGAMVLATGALTVAGAATGRRVGAIVVLDALLVLALAVALLVRVPLFSGVGDRVEHPTAVASLDRTYALGIGDFTLDLADVPLPAGSTQVKVTLGIGNLVVHVPRHATVVVDARASAGKLDVLGVDADGTNVHRVVTAPGAAGSRVLHVDARVGFGHLEVTRG